MALAGWMSPGVPRSQIPASLRTGVISYSEAGFVSEVSQVSLDDLVWTEAIKSEVWGFLACLCSLKGASV